MIRNLQNATVATLSLLIAGCAAQPRGPEAGAPLADTAACADSLGSRAAGHRGLLDSTGFSVLNWNIHKGKDPDWAGELVQATTAPDLLILQEAAPQTADWPDVLPRHYQSFAEGFGFGGSASGVLTMSSVPPIGECDLVALEPWFGTRKATLVTRYGLTGTDQTLLVVNIHGINFTFGLHDLEKQFAQARAIIAVHEGPVLFSGDFNTWHGRRMRLLDEIASGLGLSALQYREDFRRRFLGLPLDHVYIRGLDVVQATTLDLQSSDHTPIAVRLRLASQTAALGAAK